MNNLEEMYYGLGDFDTICRKDYGDKTCVIVQIDRDEPPTYQMRLLDKGVAKNITTELLARVIPDMLQYKYIVVMAKWIAGEKRDITAVHYPDSRLTAPPIFFN